MITFASTETHKTNVRLTLDLYSVCLGKDIYFSLPNPGLTGQAVHYSHSLKYSLETARYGGKEDSTAGGITENVCRNRPPSHPNHWQMS